MPMCLF